MKISTRISTAGSLKNQGINFKAINNISVIRRFKHLLTLSFLLMLVFFSSTQSFGQLITFDFSPLAGGTGLWGPSPLTPTNTNADITAVGLTRGAGVGTPGATSVAARAWGGSGFSTSVTTQAGAITANQIITMSMTAASGHTLSLSGISAYNIRRSASGPTTGIWQYQVGASSFTDIGSAITWGSTTTAAGNPQSAITLSGISALQNVSAGTTVTLRIVLWGASGTTGTWYLNDPLNTTAVDLAINGSAPAGLISQTITGFPTSDTRTYGIAPYNITGVTGGGSGNPVTFASSNPLIASISGNQVTINSVGAGTVTITASQAGNASYSAAPDVVQTLTVNKAPQTITFGALSNKNDVDANFQLTATGGASGNPVTYTSSNTAVCQIVDINGNPDVNGSYVDIVGPGDALITASQAGNGNYLAATNVQRNQHIINTNLASQTITFGALSNRVYGGANFQLTATGGGSANPVTYTSSNTSVATIVDINGNLDPNGTYVDIVGPGTTTITASQAGDLVTYNDAIPVPQQLIVEVKPLTVSTASANDKVYDVTTNATITVGSLVGVESADVGQVAVTGFAGTFADPNVNVGPPIPVTAALTLGGSASVKYSLTQPTGLSANITKASQTISFGTLPNKSPGDANFNLTATASSGLPVSYSSNNTSVASVTGTLVHIGVVGAATITATQAGNGNYFPATPVNQTQNVVAPTPVSLVTNPITDANPSAANPFTAGQVVAAHITASGVGRGTGIVGTSATNRYNANNWSTAFDATEYFEFKITPDAGYRIDFSSFAYNSQISSATGPNTWAVRSSVDGFTANIGSPTSGTSATLSTIPLTAGAYQGITSEITFRVYGWGATSATSTFSINDFTFSGNVFVAPPTATFTSTNISVCGGSNDGSITVTPSGTGPFSYSWTGITGSGNPATTPFSAGNVNPLTGLPIGYYNVTVTDGNSNTVTLTGIHIQNAFSVYVTNNGSISSACGNTGSIILYGNAGVRPYTYSIDNINYQSSNTFTGLAAGNYTGYVKDAAGCVSTKAITVGAAAAIVVSPYVRPTTCAGNNGKIEVYRTGGIAPFTYSKDGTTYQPSNIFSDLAAGTYTVYVKDSKDCVGQATVTVTAGTGLTVSANKTNTSTCVNDGTIQAIVSGGAAPYTYKLDAGSYQPGNTFSNLGANTYVLTVKDNLGCTGTANVTININPITVTAYAAAASSCESSNGSLQLFRSGGVGPFTYSIDNQNTFQPSNLFTGLVPGYYEGWVKDSKGCTANLIDIYIGPDCGQRQAPLAKNSNAAESKVKVEGNSVLKAQAYPNPTASEFMLSLEGYNNAARVSINITDVMGRVIYQTAGIGKQQYRFGKEFKAGLYNVQVIQGNDKKTIRIVKQ